MTYRSDVRPTCATCATPIDEETVVFTPDGRTLCASCARRDAWAHANRVEFAGRRRMIARRVALAIVAVGVIAIASFSVRSVVHRRRETARARRVQAEAHARTTALLQGIQRFAALPPEDGSSCDDLRLRFSAVEGGQPWVGAAELAAWGREPYPAASHTMRVLLSADWGVTPATAPEYEAAVADLARRRWVITFLRSPVENAPEDTRWHGTLVVQDSRDGRPMCWTDLHAEHFPDARSDAARAEIRAALARITNALDVARP